jgi:hypothetical protein
MNESTLFRRIPLVSSCCIIQLGGGGTGVSGRFLTQVRTHGKHFLKHKRLQGHTTDSLTGSDRDETWV